MDYRVIPHAIFTDPQLASVGLTDESAVKRGYSCRCTTLPMEYVPKAQAIKDVRGAIKMVIDDASGEVLGVHVLSPDAADVIHEGVMILRNRMTIDEIIETVHVFPTLSEAIKIAAQSFKKDVGKMSCCVE
jgi:mercuric reductase